MARKKSKGGGLRKSTTTKKNGEEQSNWTTANGEVQKGSRQRQADFVNEIQGFGVEGLDNFDQQTKVQRISRALHFANPGRKSDFTEGMIAPRQRRAAAERAVRKIQKVSRSTQSSVYKHGLKGSLIVDGTEYMLCDCLLLSCPGCFWPCYNCGGRRCSSVCQKQRSFAISSNVQSGGGSKDDTRAAKPRGVASIRRDSSGDRGLRIGVLTWMCIQNAAHTLLIRYSRARKVDEMFLPSVAVFVTEVIKMFICITVEMYNEGFTKFLSSLWSHTISQPWDTLKVCVPAMVYVVQNNLFYIAASHLEAATFMIFSQLKIFTTALFSIFILGRSLSGTQWTALLVLFVGVSLVQIDSSSVSKKSDAENPLIGLSCILIACVLSGFAGVYFEKILKGSVSLWMRNIQLALFAVPSSLVSVYAQDGRFVAEHRLLYGFDGVVWLTAFWYGIGGLSVAVCIKYADNIAKNFATSVAIILSTIGSVFLFSFSPSLFFVSGATLAIFSIFMYSSSNSFLNHIPRSLRSNLCL